MPAPRRQNPAQPAPPLGRRRGACLSVLTATLLLMAPTAAPTAARADETVTLSDLGWTNGCAEMDNVLAAISGDDIGRFTVTARHPAYMPGPDYASSAADFTDCVFPDEPLFDAEPMTATLYDDGRIRLDGRREIKSWRPEIVPVTVGDRTWPDLMLLQLKIRHDGGWVEVLVLYPRDGYWRAKPLPFPGLPDTPFGASFLLGPVGHDRRPLVRLSGVRFDPVGLAFDLEFAGGGAGRVRVESLTPAELRLGVTLDPPVDGQPFALVSSMFVAPDNADTGRIAVRPAGTPFWQIFPPVGFPAVAGAEIDLGRDVPSRHNTRAPDLRFGPFLPAE